MGPFVILEYFSISFFVFSQPRPLLDQRNKKGKNVGLNHQVMDNAYLQLRDVVSDVFNDRHAHDEYAELDLIYLELEFFQLGPFHDFFYFLLPFFLLTRFLFFFPFVFPLLFPFLRADSDLVSDLVIAIVDDFDQIFIAFLHGGVMEEHDFEHVADDGFMIDDQIHFQGIQLLVSGFEDGKDFLLPDRCGD